MVDAKRHTNSEFFGFFQSRLAGLGAESALKYKRTLSELDCFLAGHSLQLHDLDEAMVADWAAELLRRGLSRTTVVRHLNILNSLVKGASGKGMIPPDDAPRRIARSLESSASALPPLMAQPTFNAVLSILREGMKRPVGRDTFLDIFLLSLLSGVMPLAEVAMLRKKDASRFDDAARSIIDSNMAPRRDFVFDLRQSYRTPAQIRAVVAEGLLRLFSRHVAMPAEADPDALVRSVWVACAMRCGATASEALWCAGGSAPYAVPGFCVAADDVAEHRTMWMRAVNSLLVHEMPRWFAMHMRRGVAFDELRREIAENVHPAPELFYPCETIRKRVGKRTVVEDQPFISRTAFFRTRPESVLPMFHAIGDKAWCYRLSNSPGAPYAVISQSDMKRFQAAVGVFTPDIEVQPVGSITPKPGEPVIVVMAGYGNREGLVEEVLADGCGTAIFRVLLSTDYGYEWRVDVDARQLEAVK